MKVKTYGRRNKVLSTSNDPFLGGPSPCQSFRTDEKGYLTESSHNARENRTYTRRHKDILLSVFDSPRRSSVKVHDTDAALKPTIIPIKTQSEEIALSSRRISKQSPTTVEQARPVKASVETQDVDEDLSVAIGDLSLDCIHNPRHQRKPPKPIESRKLEERPAQVTASTREYLQPLLDCKNVSKCIEDFQSWMNERDGLLKIKKIGEGSFGEVYRAQGGEEAVILKLMPLNASKGKGSRSFTSITSAKNEIRLLSRMSKVPGFVEFRGACVLQGTMANQLVHEWSEYKISGRTVESKDPGKKESYVPTQLWLLIEMSDAGESLERGRYAPPKTVTPVNTRSDGPYLPMRYTWDIFWQIVRALAKGEVFAMYEHRDLHMGNICVKAKALDAEMDTVSSPSGSYNDTNCIKDSSKFTFGIDESGIEVTLIDYSLSRASIGPQETLAYDFKNDKALLKGHGDLQYDMYRHMASILGKRPSSDFVPETNLMWLYYVLQLLLDITVSELAPSDTGMLSILCNLRERLHPNNRSAWEWSSAGDMLQMGVEENWFLPEHVMDT